jgi:MoaA/NifB/PqqE/SkfB family radical SAM enzyme
MAAQFQSKFLKQLFRTEQARETKTKPHNKRRWRLLQVESSLACNLQCVMCPWRGIGKTARNGIMSQEVWEAIRPYLSQVLSVDFTGGGEPLLQPRLEEWIREAKGAGCETGFLTNGLLMKKEKMERLVRTGLDWIGVSMDGATREVYEEIRRGSDFERVCENLANLATLRVGKVPKTMINFVLMNRNFHQVEEIVRLAARLGVDQVNFKQCDVIRGEEGKGLGLFARKETKEVRRLKKALAKARRLAKKRDVRTTAFSFTPEELPVCEQDPRDSLFIRFDGLVAPCINLAYGGPTTFLGQEVTMPSLHYGHLPDEDLLGLWESDGCKWFRERFQNRVHVHDDTILESLVDASSNRQKISQAAKEAMPQSPEGCRVCHYLFDI